MILRFALPLYFCDYEMSDENMLKTNPAVFAVGNQYHIMLPVTCECVMWAKVGDKSYSSYGCSM